MSSEIKVDTISENTSANGVAIDSLGIKDGKVTNLMNATLSAADLGTGLHVKTGDSSVSSLSVSHDELIVESDGNAGISILGGTSNQVGIAFGDSGDSDVGRINYTHSDNVMRFINNGSENMTMNTDGEVTKSAQPAFCTVPASEQSNIGNNDTIVFGTERFDIGSNFASNTFTAPLTGKYQLNYSVTFGNIDIDADHMRITLVTSNKSYENLFDPGSHDTDAVFFNMSMSVMTEMDASDTAFLRFDFGGISDPSQIDIKTASSFSGFLAC